ncbi:MAG: TolC family protein [Bacteroidetes bacterium]|nr:TolC family protein [Bacteroidota bacterium]MBS1932874.1 TolC family protein [Bacteroidota bacterium]
MQANQPQLQAFKEQANAIQQNINLSKNTLVPDATVGYQANYTTYNNITGMSYPGLMMPITGPPSVNNNINFIPGTALAALIKWDPITFGQRNAATAKAVAQFQSANAFYNQAVFKQQYTALYTYIDAVYLQQLLKVFEANINRIEVSFNQSLVLARQGLRPGIDTVQFQSALAQARIDFFSAQKTFHLQLIELARLAGLQESSNAIVLSDTLFTKSLPSQPDTTYQFANNPVLQYYQSKQELSKASLKEIQTSWRPHLDVWGNAYGRGSGVEANGVIDKSYGWTLSRTNFGAGVQLSFPILQFSQINIQKKQYKSLLKSDEAMLQQSKLDLQKQMESAIVNFQQNNQIALQTQVRLQSAMFAYSGLELSYKTGLIDYTQLSQGGYELLNAGINKANSFLQVWHSLLDIAVAKGDINIFLQQLK